MFPLSSFYDQVFVALCYNDYECLVSKSIEVELNLALLGKDSIVHPF